MQLRSSPRLGGLSLVRGSKRCVCHLGCDSEESTRAAAGDSHPALGKGDVQPGGLVGNGTGVRHNTLPADSNRVCEDRGVRASGGANESVRGSGCAE